MEALNIYTLHHIPEEERPRERLRRQGAEALTTAELIAIILGSGMKGKSVLQLSQELVTRFGSLRTLAEATIEELCEVKGLGHAKATQLKAAFSLGLKVANSTIPPRYRIQSPTHAYNLVKDELETEMRELLIVILQDNKGCVICHETVSVGTVSESLIHPREVFYPAIRHKASSIILAHNHPSGDPTPSDLDYQITRQLIITSKLIHIPINDHIVIGHNTFRSMRELGLPFE